MNRIRKLQIARNTDLRAIFNLFLEWYNVDNPDESLRSYVSREARYNLTWEEANIVISYLSENQE